MDRARLKQIIKEELNRAMNESYEYTKSPEDHINDFKYVKGPGAWRAARDTYEFYASGKGDPVLRNFNYPGWTAEDFQKVIDAMDAPRAKLPRDLREADEMDPMGIESLDEAEVARARKIVDMLMRPREYERTQPRETLRSQIKGVLRMHKFENLDQIVDTIYEELVMDPKVVRYTVSERDPERLAMERFSNEYPDLVGSYEFAGTAVSFRTSRDHPLVTAIIKPVRMSRD